MIAYSPDAEPARAYLLRSYNDIDIFVEDVSCQNMYVRLFNRMLAGRGRIQQVYPLQNRKAVIEKCKCDQGDRSRRRLYLIDGDQDLILGRPSPRLKHLYRLPVYCSENLLLSEDALVTIGTECATNRSWPDMALDLAIQPLLARSVKMLLPLFVLYAIATTLRLGIETVNYSVHRLLSTPGDPTSLSESLVRSRMIAILRQIRQHASARQYRSARTAVLHRLKARELDPGIYISGKTYLLPLVYLQLKRVANLNDSVDRLKVRLAAHCDLAVATGLRRAVLRAIKEEA